MNHRRIAWTALFILAVAVPAAAFGPTTHAYLCSRVLDTRSPCAMHGAAAPDINAVVQILLGDGQAATAFRRLTHYESELLAPSLFADGFATHDEEWGADAYAHGHSDPITTQWYEGYVIILAEQLAQDTGMSEAKAHDYTELAMDVVVRRGHGPQAALNIVRGASLCPGWATRDLVEAFAPAWAEEIPSMTKGRAAFLIVLSDRIMRFAEYLLGSQLLLGEAHCSRIAPILLSLYDGTDYQTASFRFMRALQLCADCETEFARIIPLIAAEHAVHKRLAEDGGEGAPATPQE